MIDVTCLGESLATFRPARAGQSLADAGLYLRGTGGAESNVACALAAAGHRVRWVSRLGADAFGDEVLRTIAAAGVDVGEVRRDPHRPTGIYFRTDGDRGRGMEAAYYRAGSAASAMSPRTATSTHEPGTRVLHLTGITPALSDTCDALLRTLTAPEPGRPLISFDVNYRPQLWQRRAAASAPGSDAGAGSGADADAGASSGAGDQPPGASGEVARRENPPAPQSPHGVDPREPYGGAVLRELARASDLVFVGEDEAEAAWHLTGGPHAIREALPEPAAVVVKRGDHSAVLMSAEGTVAVPAPRVPVTAPVGAGDAFAAGYLSALLDGEPGSRRLRRGHLFAAAVLVAEDDHAAPPPSELVEELSRLPDAAWARLHLTADWTTRPAREIVRGDIVPGGGEHRGAGTETGPGPAGV